MEKFNTDPTSHVLFKRALRNSLSNNSDSPTQAAARHCKPLHLSLPLPHTFVPSNSFDVLCPEIINRLEFSLPLRCYGPLTNSWSGRNSQAEHETQLNGSTHLQHKGTRCSRWVPSSRTGLPTGAL
jgi:hypothetical protein